MRSNGAWRRPLPLSVLSGSALSRVCGLPNLFSLSRLCTRRVDRDHKSTNTRNTLCVRRPPARPAWTGLGRLRPVKYRSPYRAENGEIQKNCQKLVLGILGWGSPEDGQKIFEFKFWAGLAKKDFMGLKYSSKFGK